MKKYKLELTKKQLQVLTNACEVAMRLGIGQIKDALSLLPLSHNSMDYEKWHNAQDDIGNILSQFTKGNVDGIRSSFSIHNPDVRTDTKLACDMNQTMRHHLAWEDAVEKGIVRSMDSPRNWMKMVQTQYDTPYKYGNEPLPTITTIADDNQDTVNLLKEQVEIVDTD